MGPNVLGVHVLRPYDGWEIFRPRVAKALGCYLDVSGSDRVCRVSVQFINVVAFQDPDVCLDEYFLCWPPSPPGLRGRLGNFVSQTETLYDDGAKLVVTFARINASEAPLRCVLDLNMIFESPDPLIADAALSKVDDLHDRQGNWFEALITDRTRVLEQSTQCAFGAPGFVPSFDYEARTFAGVQDEPLFDVSRLLRVDLSISSFVRAAATLAPVVAAVSADAAASEPRFSAALPSLACVAPVDGLMDDMAMGLDCRISALDELHASLNEMTLLVDNWDEEGAPKPSDDAIERARSVLRWTAEAGVAAFDLCVDPDVLGGVAVLIWRNEDTRAWIACHNNGRDTVVCSDADGVKTLPWNDQAKAVVSAFLRGERRP
jgi:hypothetical protein